jgi:CDP-2,3-bis-(O-geranylgeranyl)-sn-glycerol synthase
MDAAWECLRLLVLLATANVAPIAAKRLLGARGAVPLDGGLRFVDGRPLFGASKTVRGIVVAVAATAALAPLLGVPAVTGAWLGALAMAGDLLSSFAKRRLGVPSGGKSTGLDQVPEALLPLLVLQDALAIAAWQVVVVTLAFFLLEMPAARVAFRFGLRDTPH